MPHEYVDNELDRRVEQFDSAWRRGEIPSIADELAFDDRQELAADQLSDLLRELVMIDLEYRWRNAAEHANHDRIRQLRIPRQPRLEDYLAIYPELGPLKRLSTELIASEYRARHRWGDRPNHTEYLRLPK